MEFTGKIPYKKKKKEEVGIRLENIGFYKRRRKEEMIGKSLKWFD